MKSSFHLPYSHWVMLSKEITADKILMAMYLYIACASCVLSIAADMMMKKKGRAAS